jgi:hypothetical protein
MASTREFQCEVCGLVAVNPTRWFVIRCGDSELIVHRWDSEAPKRREHDTTAGEGTPKCTSARGSSQFAPRRNQAPLANC